VNRIKIKEKSEGSTLKKIYSRAKIKKVKNSEQRRAEKKDKTK